ncbi:MAG: hypothetical protein FWE83_03225 [Oscillospiraceae bacterium]|nr:hypothetical protein [Oscillospiraceae bacterium]
MFYKKSMKPFSAELFKNPPSEYRATPFWAWNNELDAAELKWQIEQFKLMGFGGFHMHVRTGLATEYLSEEYMEIIKACVNKARDEKMLAWLYDEDRWPSGAAGGIITKDKKFRAKHLLLTRQPYGSEVRPEKKRKIKAQRSENGKLLMCFDITLSSRGFLTSYREIKENEKPEGFKIYVYEETQQSSPWYNNQTYLNTLDPASVAEFIKVTYERYNETVSNDFGKVIPAIFTDEPQFTFKETLAFSHDIKDVFLPWTTDLPETYHKTYGSDLLNHLPELIWDSPEGKISKARYRYHDHVAERFSSAFADQCGKWCGEHGLMLTGHMMEEPTLESQTAALGEAMRSYRSFQLPGIDMLCDRREYTTAKQAQSAARQYGRPGVLSELYGVTNWDFDFRGHKLQGDWQAALGVTVRVPHLSWVSMNGEAKRDYPSTFSYQSAWYKEYPYIEDHFARVNTVMTRGKAVCKVGVIHPVESYWLHWGAQETSAAVRDQMDKNFHALCDWLLRGCIDFDYISESLLPEQGSGHGDGSSVLQHKKSNTETLDKAFPVGRMSYEIIIVPNAETIRESTLERLEEFAKTGGRVIMLGKAPVLVDAERNNRADELQCEHIPFERIPLLNALADIRDVEIRSSDGAMSEGLFYQLREEVDCRWLFIAQADKPVNPDIPQGDVKKIKVRGKYCITVYDTLTGDIKPIKTELNDDWTCLDYLFYEHDSLLLRLDVFDTASITLSTENHVVTSSKQTDNCAAASAVLAKCAIANTATIGSAKHYLQNLQLFLSPVPITLHEPNVLLLDMAEFALDDEEYRLREEVLRLDNILRSELKWPLRGNAIAQPWVESDTSTPHVLRLKYTFNSEVSLNNAELALENAAVTDVTLNGRKASPVEGWYVDKCIGKVPLPEITVGKNVIEMTVPYGKKTDIEACYLLGDFGVKVQGINCTLAKPVTELAFGDITRQGLPFYGGNLTYHLEVSGQGTGQRQGDGSSVLTAKVAFPQNEGKQTHLNAATEVYRKTDEPSPCPALEISIPYYRGHLLRVAVDGNDVGVIAFSPYRIKTENLNQNKTGKHKIDLTYFGSRINTFGQLHRNNRHDPWCGPDSWRTTGDAWTYEYRFWSQGVLKSPEVW